MKQITGVHRNGRTLNFMILVTDDHKDNFYSHVQVSYINFNLICHYLYTLFFFLMVNFTEHRGGQCKLLSSLITAILSHFNKIIVPYFEL